MRGRRRAGCVAGGVVMQGLGRAGVDEMSYVKHELLQISRRLEQGSLDNASLKQEVTLSQASGGCSVWPRRFPQLTSRAQEASRVDLAGPGSLLSSASQALGASIG